MEGQEKEGQGPPGCGDAGMRERMARIETVQDRHHEEMDQLREGLTNADQKIEARFNELSDRLRHMEKLQNRTFWLLVGGFSIITGGGALVLWMLRVVTRAQQLLGGG